MAGFLSGETSQHEAPEGNRHERLKGGGHWYFSRKEIEENSPSRQDGIDLKKENYLRKSYCTCLQDLGMKLKVPQVTIATAIIFCHRFFLHQSHAKNDRRTIATVCMFLAGKVEETPRPLKDVILVSYEIIHKKDAAAVQRIKQKEVYEQQKELILQGERVVLATLGFDLNLQHPYKPLVEAIKKFQVAQNTLAQVAWNFVNDGLRASLCLQFKPHHIAAGAIFLAAKFLKVKLPSDGEKVWWQEFDVTPRQLEEVSNQMLELYEQSRVPPSQASEGEGRAVESQRPPLKDSANEQVASFSSVRDGAASKAVSSKPAQSRLMPYRSCADSHSDPEKVIHTRNVEYESSKINNNSDQREKDEIIDSQHDDKDAMPHLRNSGIIKNKAGHQNDGSDMHDQEGNSGLIEARDIAELKDKSHGRNVSRDSTVTQSPQDAIKNLDRQKVKAALERRKARGELPHNMDPVDELERELENVELPSEREKIKREENKESWSKPSKRSDHENSPNDQNLSDDGDEHYQSTKGRSLYLYDFDTVEAGEVETFADADGGCQSSRSSIRKRKACSPSNNPLEEKPQTDHVTGSHKQNHFDYHEDSNGSGKLGYPERNHKRSFQENHI